MAHLGKKGAPQGSFEISNRSNWKAIICLQEQHELQQDEPKAHDRESS